MKLDMKNAALLVAAFLPVVAYCGGFALAERGRPPACTIVVSDSANAVQKYAAEELRDHVKRITGVTLPIAIERGSAARAVVLSSGHFEDDGFRLRTDKESLFVEGGARCGVLYGVYEILERFGGCGWFAPGVETIPEADSLAVPYGLDVREKPAFVQRDSSWYGVKHDRVFAARLRHNGVRSSGDDPRLGGPSPHQFDKVLGNCHTFHKMIPAKRYFKDHPEYFSEKNGVRTANPNNEQSSQLCLTNPDVERIVISNVMERIRSSPGVRYFGVSQNDTPNSYCTCKACKAIDDEEESHAGTMIRFVNRVAEAVEKEFPDVTIETLAYHYSQKPPKLTRPRHNVMPCLCSIRCDFSRPMAESRYGENAKFRDDIRRWREISNLLYVWDYPSSYSSYLMAMPNIRTLRENLRFFRDNGVTHLYEQGNGQGPHGWFAELKAWITSKLEWNPDQPLEPLLARFFAGYYGAAAPAVRRYFDAVSEECLKRDETVVPLTCGEYETSEAYPQDFFDSIAPFWEEALAAVKDDPVRREAVEWGRLSSDFIRAMRFRVTPSGAKIACVPAGYAVDGARRLEMQGIVRDRVLPLLERKPHVRIREGELVNNNALETLRAFAAAPAQEAVGPVVALEERHGGISAKDRGEFVDDPAAEDGRAARLEPGAGWTYRLFVSTGIACVPGSSCRLRIRARVVKRAGADGVALDGGVYNLTTKKYKIARKFKASEMSEKYAWYDLGVFAMSTDDEIYISPGLRNSDGSLASNGLFVDKMELSLVDSPSAKDTRPYEFRLADRKKDFREPCADFENAADWRVETSDAEATFECNSARMLFGAKTGELRYRGNGKSPVVRLFPKKPVKAPADADSLTVWVRGNHWGHGANRQFDIPSPDLFAEIRLKDGTKRKYKIAKMIWLDWYLVAFRLPEADAKTGMDSFLGFSLEGKMQGNFLSMHFDNLALFRDPRGPLSIQPRAKRNLKPLPDADQGVNTGSGTLPFPICEETILPAAKRDDALAFSCEEGVDGPDFRVSRDGSAPVSVFADGGVKAIVSDAGLAVKPTRAKRLKRWTDGGDTVERWQHSAPGAEAVVVFAYRRMGNSMVVDMRAEKGAVAEVSAGDVAGVDVRTSFTVPYLAYGPDVAQGSDSRRAPVVAFDARGRNGKSATLFRYAAGDWYRSNASRMDGDLGASRRMTQRFYYLPKSDGKYVPLSERIFINVSTKFDEVLPSIPNPPSPLKHITGKRLWRAHASSESRERDRLFWRTLHRYGITEVIVNDHETMWRDGGESYTFRTSFAEKKGGDKGQYDYTRFMRDELGYFYGPYDNFWDYAPVNENFTFDNVAMRSDGSYMTSWMRCYAPKAVTAPEWSERIVPEVQRKMKFNTCYCDCHTAGSPWCRTDYDARVPGAGTFSAAFYAFGELLLCQRRDWQGPIYSEGSTRYFYAGLIDGNYADDRGYAFQHQPWIVDFDLLKLHPLECDFGMGTVSMFYPDNITLQERRYYLPHFNSKAEREEIVDRYLAATVAFGHSGFLIAEYCFDPPRNFGPAYGPTRFGRFAFADGMPIAWRSYYMIQAAAARYTQSDVAEIGYVNGRGEEERTSEALLSGTVARNQIHVLYKDGTEVASNGSRKERMRVRMADGAFDLPPCGYRVRSADGKVVSECSDRGGRKADYAESPDYIYIDGRGRMTERAKAKADGPAVCRVLADGYEIIPFGETRCSFRIDGGRAVALDLDGREIGPAKSSVDSDGWYSVKPVLGAVSYKVSRDRSID